MRQDTDLERLRALPFTMTAGQKHAVEEITADLCGDAPMNRLLQGDVGSGKLRLQRRRAILPPGTACSVL